MAQNRYLGSYPAIGIRPVIDGRRGPLKVRESLEEQTMNMAKSAAKLFEENLRYSNGDPVKVVIADTTIGRVAETAACEEKFRREGVAITLTVTPCWCYGSETMDMDRNTIKAVWGLNATERPGAVYLASVLATHAQKGLPAFGIYGHDVQDADDTVIPEDVKEKLLRFGRAAVAVATMRGKSYLQIGSICMGIGGSIIDSKFIEEYLGMRVESVDEVEIIRRMTEGIYDQKEFEKLKTWAARHVKEGFDKNPEAMQRSKEQKAKDWEFTLKMYLIIKDLMNGNPNLPKGAEEEMVGHNAIAGGFQGQRQWTDFYPNCDFPEAMLNTSFDHNGAREPYVLATENDVLNGLGMLFMKLLTNRAQMFADVRTFWSPASVKRVTGYDLEGKAKENGGIIHLINSGACCLDANGQARDKDGNRVMKPWYEVTEADPEAMLNTSFDHNGTREPYILATENDVLNGLGMLFMKLLTNKAQMFADVRTFWSPASVKRVTGYDLEGKAKENGGIIHLINSGACCLDANGQARDAAGNRVMKPWYEVTEADQEAIMAHTTWNYADLGYFRGGGYSSRFVTDCEMPATMIRLNLVDGLGPMLQIAEGWTVELPDEVNDILWKRTDYTWPCTWFAPRCDGKEGSPFKTAYEVMGNWGANHGAISYGHIGADLITFASMLRIPVAMHNVP
ncbi:MAG: hypothetical protein IKE76_10685, partial [Clostridia bacterium]|nr:hypothetical protein [Clostridia bacterium]